MSEHGVRQWLSAKEGWRGQKRRDSEGTRSLLGVIDMFITSLVVIFLWVFTYVKTCQLTHLKYVRFIVSQSLLNKAVILKNGTKLSISSFQPKIKIEFDQNIFHVILVRFLLSQLRWLSKINWEVKRVTFTFEIQETEPVREVLLNQTNSKKTWKTNMRIIVYKSLGKKKRKQKRKI